MHELRLPAFASPHYHSRRRKKRSLIGHKATRDRVLNDAEIAAFWRACEFDAADVLPAAGAALLTHLRELADDRHGAAMGARERLETIRENRNRLQGTINSTRNLRGYQNADQLAKHEAIARRSGREGRGNLDENLVSRRQDDCGVD